MSRRRIVLGIGLLIGIATLFILGKKELFTEYYSKVKMQLLSDYLNNSYLYDVNSEASTKGIYKGYLDGLENPVTGYLEEEEFKAAQIAMQGNYFGVGMQFMWQLDGQSFIVTKVIKDSPADQKGIEVGDAITKVNNIKVIRANQQRILEEGFSMKDEAIRYVVKHRGQIRTVSITPAEVKLVDLESQMINDVLYIRIQAIQNQTSNRLEALINETDFTICKGIILDVRDLQTDNVDEISKISDLFLEEQVAFKIKTKKEDTISYTMTEGSYPYELCIITNTSSQAGAEALVLALRHRATLVGSSTAGLDYLRVLIPLEDGTGVSVASGIIYDAYGEKINEKGIEPDIRVYTSSKERKELLEKGAISLENDSFINEALLQFR